MPSLCKLLPLLQVLCGSWFSLWRYPWSICASCLEDPTRWQVGHLRQQQNHCCEYSYGFELERGQLQQMGQLQGQLQQMGQLHQMCSLWASYDWQQQQEEHHVRGACQR